MNWKIRYTQFWKNHFWISSSIHTLIFIFLLADFIIGSKPILCFYKKEFYCFLWSKENTSKSDLAYDLNQIAQGDYRNLSYDFVWWPILYRDAQKLEPESAWLKPGALMKDGSKFILGSYDLGKDLLVACFAGFKKSVSLALITLLISLFPALLIGSLFVFHSNRYQSMSFVSIVFFLIALLAGIYSISICLEWRAFPQQLMLLFLLSICCFVFSFFTRNIKPQLKFILDAWSLRYLEVMKSIPVLLILLILLQIIHQPNQLQFACMLAFIVIPYLVKYARAFTLKAVNENFITAAIAIGQSGWKVYSKHVLPKVLQDLIPVLAFGLANIILLEASLSFIGIGFDINEISLGGILFTARSNPSAWWVIVFPGFLIFYLVAFFNQLGNLFSTDLLEDSTY